MKDTFEIIGRVPNQPIGWLETKLPKSAMERLQEYIETAKKNPISVTDTLAGNISKSLNLVDKDKWFFNKILQPCIDQYTKSYPKYVKTYSILTEDVPWIMDLWWVNFQKQHEFNPIHNHGGVFSFVIWVKIPTDWREQHALPISANSNAPRASNFEFQFSSMMGTLATSSYPLDKESEGSMLFFPAKLQHQVYPFYNCDKERISISGNIRFNTSSMAT
jgi:hypothetical protein